MIFPNNFLKLKEAKANVIKNSPAYVTMFIVIVVCLFLGVFIYPYTSVIMSFKVNEIICFIIAILIDIIVFRKLIVREDQKLAEIKQNPTNNISGYFRVLTSGENSDYRKIPFTVFDNYNGTPFIVLRLKLGSHMKKPLYTERFLIKLFRYLGEEGLIFNKITTEENFSENRVWKYQINQLDEIKSLTFKKYFRQIISYLKTNFSKVKIPVTYIKINLFHKFQAKEVVGAIYRMYEKEHGNFREMHFCNEFEFVNFCKDYHLLENLDLDLSQSLELNELPGFEVVKVYDYYLNIIEEKHIEDVANLKPILKITKNEEGVLKDTEDEIISLVSKEVNEDE